MAVSHQLRWTISLSEKGVYNRDSRNTNCSTRENLPIDISIVMAGLILTRRDRVQYCNRRQGNQKRMLFSRIGSATSHAENQMPRITKECNEHEWETWTKAPIKYVDENINHGPLTHSHALLFIWIMSVFCTVEKFSLVCRACRKETNDICRLQHKTALGFVSDGVSPGENPEGRDEKNPRGGWEPRGSGQNRGSGRENWKTRVRYGTSLKPKRKEKARPVGSTRDPNQSDAYCGRECV